MEEVELSYEKKVSLDELIKQAKPSEKAANQRIITVAGALKNLTKGPLNVFTTKIWAGDVVKNFSDPLNSLGAFEFSALSSEGIKAAVVYSGKFMETDYEYIWLLAFDVTNVLVRRVYAEGGPKSKFNNINWDQIEHKLSQSGTMATAPGVHATIVGMIGGHAVAAIFD